MRVTDLNEMTSIDQNIQELLGDLQELYAKRQSIVEPKQTHTKKTSRSANTSRLSDISLDDIDLTLPDFNQPKRRRIFG